MRPALSPSELVRALRDPVALERRSPLFGESAVWVDLGQEPPAEARAADAWGRLAELPAVAVGIACDGVAPGAAALAEALDLVVRREDEREAVRSTVERAPLASLVLVQLLRRSLAQEPSEGLLAESLAYSTLQAGPEFAAWRAGRRARKRDSDAEPAVRARREGDELRLELNRPHKRNAFSAEMRDALCEALALVIQDASLRRVVLCGAGPSFCSGGDLDEFGALPDPATAHAIRSTRNAAALLARVAGRVEARVHGACVGAGAELPAFCRRVVAHPDAFFQLPELAFGLVPGAGGTVSLPRRIGRQRTAWLALTGWRLPAAEALAWGLVDELAAWPRRDAGAAS